MKQHFEDTLRVFSDVAKEKEKGEIVAPFPEIKKRLKNVEAEGEILNLEEMIPEAARVSVLEVQEKKQQIIQWIHKRFNDIDEGKSVRSIHKKKKGQDDYYVDEKMNVEWNGETIPVTKGLLATDGEWGNSYTLNQGVPRDVKKTFVVAEAKREMLHLLNQQEAHTETKREIPKWIDGTAKDILRSNQGNYAKSLNYNHGDERFAEGWGFVAETLVSTLMEMLRVDGKLPYSFVAGDSFDDYERKIDFYIHIPSHVRGVKSQTEDREDVGIQFYGGKKEAHRRSKQKQIIDAKKQFGFLHDIDDIVLVNIPLNLIEGLYEEWKKNGKRPGGVTGLLSTKMKKEIFDGVLEGFFKKDRISELWEVSGKNMQNTDEEKIEELKRKIENGIGDTKTNLRAEKESESKMSKQELAQKAEELLRNSQKPRIPDEGGEENLNKFANKYGKWFGKKK